MSFTCPARLPRVVLLTALFLAGTAAFPASAALSSADIARLCTDADGSSDCGRRIEKTVIAAMPEALARRDGDTLTLHLLPEAGVLGAKARTVSFTDKDDATHSIAYAVWDYLPLLDAVLLYVNEGVNAHFLWVARSNGKTVSLPAEPVLAIDSKRLATADFCPSGCDSELAVWQIVSDVPVKTLRWSPTETWTDAEVSWSLTGALNVSYQKKGTSSFSRLTRSLNDKDWKKVAEEK